MPLKLSRNLVGADLMPVFFPPLVYVLRQFILCPLVRGSPEPQRLDCSFSTEQKAKGRPKYGENTFH